MMKKILLVAALLAVMLPLAAADKEGKWYVEADYGYENASGLDTVYAYSYGYNYPNGLLATQSKTFVAGPSNSGSWTLELGYDAGDWTAWVSYYKFDDTTTSIAAHENTYFSFVLINPLAFPVDPVYGYDGFIYADEARATTDVRFTRFDINAGRKFKPTENWTLMFYSGLSYINLEAKLDVMYYDMQDWNLWGEGSTDQVTLQSNSKGWGLNMGFTSTTQIGKRVEVTGGLEVTMARLARTNTQSEWYYSSYYGPDYGAWGTWPATYSDSKMMPFYTAFLEGNVKITDHFFTKIGYKYTSVQDALSYGMNTNDYPFLAGWSYDSKDFGVDGLYFGLTWKF